MKRVFLVFGIFGLGSISFFGLQNQRAKISGNLNTASDRLAAQTERFETLQIEQQTLSAQNRESRQTPFRPVQMSEMDRELAQFVNGREWTYFSDGARERLFADLDVNWNSSPDYVLVSKENTLREISLKAISEGDQVTDAVAEVLAITPQERIQINATLQQVIAKADDYLRTNCRRIESSGDIVVQYEIPPNPEFLLVQSNAVARVAISTLGNERAKFFIDYSRDWLGSHGIGHLTNRITVKKLSGGRPYWWESAGGNGLTVRNSNDFFPAAFRSIFPNGWTDFAAREGLPSDFWIP